MRSPTAQRSLLIALLGALAFGAIILGAGPAAATHTGGNQTDARATTMWIDLQSDGQAQWTVTMRFSVESENESAAFDRLASDFEAGESDVLSVDPFREAADRAGEATGRTMNITSVSRTADRTDAALELSFTWTQFARTTGDRLALGDVFTTPTGTWLPRLTERQTLVIEFPPAYSVQSSSRALENRTFSIEGPAEFDPGRPSAILVRQGPGTTTVTPASETPSPAFGISPVFGIGALLVLVVILVLLLERRRRGAGVPTPTGNGNGDGGPVIESGDGSGAAGAEPAPDSGPLLSDEERILRLLHSEGGRMKQAAIVEDTDWSNAKVSQLLSEMAENGDIDKLRIGRENLISLPGELQDEE